MKKYNWHLSVAHTIACSLIAMLLIMSCRKEKTPAPSDLDENVFVVKDNPNDPVDHAVYEFYKNTGIASFYNDTIHRRRLRDSAGIPRYSYVTLSLDYGLFGSTPVYFKPVLSRDKIPALLNLLKQQVLPELPSNLTIPSFFFLDSFWVNYQLVEMQISHGWTALRGFNTVAVKVKDVETMNTGERKMYAASILAGLAEYQIKQLANVQLQKEFLSISREAAKTILPVDVYTKVPIMFLMPPDMIPPPATLGFIRYVLHGAWGAIPLPGAPGEADDVRAFLTCAFYYTPQEFSDLYPNETLLLNKFNIIRKIGKEAGFRFPD